MSCSVVSASRTMPTKRMLLVGLIALTAPYLLWWANYWNLLGFRF